MKLHYNKLKISLVSKKVITPLFSLNLNDKKCLSTNLKPICLATVLSIIPLSSYGGLSATTATTIMGYPPALSFDGVTAEKGLERLLTFEMPDGQGGQVTIEPTIKNTIEADPDWRFNQFVAQVKADGLANNLPSSYYYDIDGDLPDKTLPVAGTLTATWSYQVEESSRIKTITLSESDLAEKLDACNAPYTLTISAKDVIVQSNYGTPLSQDYGSLSKSYTVNVTDYKFCFAKPIAMITASTSLWLDADGSGTWNSGNPNRTTTYGGGYSSDFDLVRGFKASAPVKFPRTGFAKAQFQLLMSNAQDAYSYEALENGGKSTNVSVNNKGGIIINSKPDGEVIIRATPNKSNYPAIDYAFTLGLWAVPNSTSTPYSKNLCDGVENQLTRADFTNSPYNDASGSVPNNAYTRAIDGGLFAEWGLMNYYPNSGWSSGNYWTNEKVSKVNSMFVVNSQTGRVNGNYSLTANLYIACKG